MEKFYENKYDKYDFREKEKIYYHPPRQEIFLTFFSRNGWGWHGSCCGQLGILFAYPPPRAYLKIVKKTIDTDYLPTWHASCRIGRNQS